MRGSPKYQISQIYNESGIKQIGQSKHVAKAAAREGGARTWAEIGQKVGIHSYKTADAYRETWKRCLEHARAESGLKDITKMEGRHVESYLKSVAERGCSHATFSQYCAALNKLDQALNLYSEKHDLGKSYDLALGVTSARDFGTNLQKFEGSRAYDRPADLVAAVPAGKHQLAALIQYETGVRINEVGHIRPDQLRGNELDVQGKGGKQLTKTLTPETAAQLRGELERGSFQIDKDNYRDDLKAAAAQTGQDYNGSHGLRWNYAQEQIKARCSEGTPYYQALGEVSREMGHERPDITEHYLR
jgi:hypothetical protein